MSQPKTFGPPEIQPEELEPDENKILGKGEYGTVYEGKCRGQIVAIKIFHRQFVNTDDIKDFRNEIEAFSNLSGHPNVLSCMGACLIPGNLAVVMELMPNGTNLDKVIRNTKLEVSLVQRLVWGKEISKGMLWLHCTTPNMIIHKDLKPSNVVIDEHGHARVCDFGLSSIKPNVAGATVSGRDANGSPLWMAPEALLGQAFDEKVDVYSFGILLWQLVTRKQPFSHHSQLKPFTDAVCNQRERPPIKDEWPLRLKNLLQLCWHPRPARRPTFAQIIEQMDSLIIESALGHDPDAIRFWAKHWLGKEEVEWPVFAPKFYEFIHQTYPQPSGASAVPVSVKSAYEKYKLTDSSDTVNSSEDESDRPSQQDGDDGGASSDEDNNNNENPAVQTRVTNWWEGSKRLQCLQTLLAQFHPDHTGPERDEMVCIERFGSFLQLFGPLLDEEDPQQQQLDDSSSNSEKRAASTTAHQGILKRMIKVCHQPWFHGFCDRKQAESLCMTLKPYNFLVRISDMGRERVDLQPRACFTITKVGKNRRVNHQRIAYVPGQGYSVTLQPSKEQLEQLKRGGGGGGKDDLTESVENVLGAGSSGLIRRRSFNSGTTVLKSSHPGQSLRSFISSCKSELKLNQPVPASPFVAICRPNVEFMDGYIQEGGSSTDLTESQVAALSIR